MKTRFGFVSNSSSASFVVVWRCQNDEYSLEETVDFLFDIEPKNEYGNKDLVADASEVVAKTVKRAKNYETRFFTVMYNDINDFGTAPKSLLMALATNDGPFELLYTKVEED